MQGSVFMKKTVKLRGIFSTLMSGCLLTGLVFVVFFTGCGSSTSVDTAGQSSSGQGVAAASPEKDVQDAVAKFLDAVREGKDDEVFQMLTPKAREVCGKDKLPSVPASDTAQFRVDQVRILSTNEAQAQTTMIDYDLKGNPVEDSLAWALRNTDEGWKIAGTACVFFEGMEPVIINFESKEAIAAAEKQVIQQQQEMQARLDQLRSANGQPQPQAQGQQPKVQR